MPKGNGVHPELKLTENRKHNLPLSRLLIIPEAVKQCNYYTRIVLKVHVFIAVLKKAVQTDFNDGEVLNNGVSSKSQLPEKQNISSVKKTSNNFLLRQYILRGAGRTQ